MLLGNLLARALLKPFRGQVARAPADPHALGGPGVPGALGWLWIFDSTFSVINWALKAAGWLGPGQWYYWLGDTTLA